MNAREAGRLGLPLQPGMDELEYLWGQRDAREREQNGIPGVAFTLLLVAPVIVLFYPVLGLTLWGVFLALLVVGKVMPVPWEYVAMAGFVICVGSFFPGYKLEVRASQFMPYRLVRTAIRLGSPFLTSVIGATDGPEIALDQFYLKPVSAGTLVLCAVVGIFVWLLLRWLDGLYFPVETEGRAIGWVGSLVGLAGFKRAVYSLLWIVPVMFVMHLAIRLIVGALAPNPLAIKAFYDQYVMFVLAFDFAVWLVLAVTGVLPGTGRPRRSRMEISRLA